AQNFDAATLEKIRMPSNIETPTEKLLQILLVGQPELREKLERPELRQLRQRIALQCRLSPLSREQIRDYIETRLRVAGARHHGLFSEEAQTRIAVHSRGIPRRVNILCDHCLVIGYVAQHRPIEFDIVDHAIEALEGEACRVVCCPSLLARASWERCVLGGFAAAALAVIAVAPPRFDAAQILTLARHVRDLFLR